jgi:hypothetical protein
VHGDHDVGRVLFAACIDGAVRRAIAAAVRGGRGVAQRAVGIDRERAALLGERIVIDDAQIESLVVREDPEVGGERQLGVRHGRESIARGDDRHVGRGLAIRTGGRRRTFRGRWLDVGPRYGRARGVVPEIVRRGHVGAARHTQHRGACPAAHVSQRSWSRGRVATSRVIVRPMRRRLPSRTPT